MNRAERRLFAAQNRPSGAFYGELQKRATQRAYVEAMRARMTTEANGAPIPPEIAAGMTKPRETEDLWQIGVTMKDTGEVKFLRAYDARERPRRGGRGDQPTDTRRPT